MRDVLDIPWAYLLWQRPFIRQKVALIVDELPRDASARVLDVGCGPGTNRSLFGSADYTGIDLNPAYIAAAHRAYPHSRFIQADCRDLESAVEGRFDCILMNSLGHHLNDETMAVTLDAISGKLTDGGSFHFVDLFMGAPGGRIGDLLARLDRGEHPRTLEACTSFLATKFSIDDPRTFHLKVGPLDLWNMVYIKAQRRS